MQPLPSELVCQERCLTAWQTGGDSRLAPTLRKRYPQVAKPTRHKSHQNGTGYVRMAMETRPRAISDPLPLTPSIHIRDGNPWMSWSSRSSTAVGAGRSKAKKGKTSGGRIEQRPRREGSNSQSQPAGQGQKQMRRDSVKTEDEEINRTWQEAGLGDRRAGGKFKADAGDQRKKEATRVGGWGRDKSMQRILTPEQQRAESRRGRERQVKDREGSAVVKKKGKKPYEGFDSNPRGDHPPEYYKYGPYGPFAWKGITVGKLVEGEMHTENVVFFTHVENEAEHEDREMANVAVEYTRAVADFDEDVGIQYFYAFARRRVGPRGDPWQDWTLVAQIAVESGAVFDEQGKLFEELGSWSQDLTTKCVAWARPDLTYVRKPKFQLRLEPQEQFLMETMNLVDSADPGSYYSTLCRLVNVDVGASAGRVRRGFEALDEEERMECLKHIFTRHPVKILASARHDRQFRGEQADPIEGSGLSNGSALEIDNEEENLVDVEGYNGSSVEDDEDFHEDGRQTSEATSNYAESRYSTGERRSIEHGGQFDSIRAQYAGVGEKASEMIPKTRSSELPWSESRGLLHVFGPPRSVSPRKVVYTKRQFKSAVRPFSYANLVEEIAQMRELISGKETVIYTVTDRST